MINKNKCNNHKNQMKHKKKKFKMHDFFCSDLNQTTLKLRHCLPETVPSLITKQQQAFY